ncbi:MAG: type IV pilin protein [Methylomicrobium sp.]
MENIETFMRDTRIKACGGFTLIELMIVVAVVGILAGIAIPSYQDSVRKSRRADAKAALLELSNFMERLYTETNCYNPGPDRECGNDDDAAPELPFSTSPKSGTAYYDLSLVADAIDTGTFALQATPVEGGPQESDVCGTLTITHTGAKSPSTAGCW